MRSIVVLSLVAALTACGGDETNLPDDVQARVVTVEKSLAARDAELTCRAAYELQEGLARWQEEARGKLAVLVHEAMQRLDRIVSPCVVPVDLAEGGPKLDAEQLEHQTRTFTRWLRDEAKMSTSYFAMFAWLVAGVAAFTAIVVIRRKFFG